jgi:antitoxin component of MazEF toxin-antitoxin module
MDAKIVAIGNSRGVRIPKGLLRQAQFDTSRPVRLKVQNRAIVIEQSPDPRAGWESAFKASRPRRSENLWGELPPAEGWDQ